MITRDELALPILTAAIACGATVIDEGPTTGDDGQACYPNGTCNSGLVCVSTICTTSPDGGTTNSDGGVSANDGGVTPLDSGDTPDAAPIDVGTIPGLTLWVDAAKKVTLDADGGVTTWGDQSPAGNSLQPVAGQPLAEAVALSINSLPAIHGVVQSDSIYSIFSMPYNQWGDNEFIIEAVERVPLGHGAGWMATFEKPPAPVVGFELSCASARVVFDGSDFNISGTTSVNDGVARVIGIRKAINRVDSGLFEESLTVRVNGTIEATMAKPDEPVDPPGGGGITQLVKEWDGDVSEIIIVVAPSIPNGDVDGVERYLKTKYAL